MFLCPAVEFGSAQSCVLSGDPEEPVKPCLDPSALCQGDALAPFDTGPSRCSEVQVFCWPHSLALVADTCQGGCCYGLNICVPLQIHMLKP